MYYSYEGLERFLSVKGMTKTALAAELGISSKTMAKMSKGEKIADHVLKRITDYFSCSVTELCAEKSDNPILQTLRDEKTRKSPAGCITSCKCAWPITPMPLRAASSVRIRRA